MATQQTTSSIDNSSSSDDIYTSKFPIYSLSYHQPTSTLILGGGGGPSRSGIPNGLLLLRIQPASGTKSNFAFKEAGELRTGDEAVMSLSLYDDLTDCLVVAGVNDRCWLLEYEYSTTGITELTSEAKSSSRVSSIINSLNKGQQPPKSSSDTPPLNLLRTIQSDASPNDDGYLRVTRFAPSGRSFLAAGSDGCVREWAVPEMRLLSKFETGGEILDTDSFENSLALVTSTGSIQLNISKKEKDNHNPIILSPSTASAYKFVRFLKSQSQTPTSSSLLVAVENVKALPKSSKRSPRVVFFDLDRLIKDETISILKTQNLPITKNCTCFALTNDFLSLGFADGSLLILSTLNSSLVFLQKKAIHPFPVTGLAVDPSKRILLSSSADGTVLIHQIPSNPIKTISSTSTATLIFIFFLVSLAVLLVAILLSTGKISEIDDFDSFYKLFPAQDQLAEL